MEGESAMVVPEYSTSDDRVPTAMATPAELENRTPLDAIRVWIRARTKQQQQKLLAAAVVAAALVLTAVLVFALSDEPDLVSLSALPGRRSDPPAMRTKQLLAQMTPQEKSLLLRGAGESVVELALAIAGLRVPHPCGDCPLVADNPDSCLIGQVCGNARLKIPTLRMNDGPQGFRVPPPTTHGTELTTLVCAVGLVAGLGGCCCWSVLLGRSCCAAARIQKQRQQRGQIQTTSDSDEQTATSTTAPDGPTAGALLRQSCWPAGAALATEKTRITIFVLFALSVLLMASGLGQITVNVAPTGATTAFPASLTVAASFDREITELWGRTMAEEFRAMGANVMLGPGLSLARLPHNGRNFEYLSGEDPYLGESLAGPAVRGIQSQHVMANAKHFVDNSQEIGRQGITEVVDERSQWELYYPPFLGAVEAGVLSVMCSYNRVQLSGQQSEGIFSCDNPLSLQHLKQGMNFTGFVISDWYATPPPRLPMSSLKAGLDIEMPGSKCNWLLQHITPAGFALPGGQPAACTHMSPEKISDALDRGDITRADVDDSVTRILNALFAIGEMDEPNLNTPGVVATAAHHATAAEIAAAGTVLLKNQDTKGQPLLPIPLPAPHSGDFTGHAGGGEVLSIAVIGHEALGKTVGGGGSGAVTPSNLTSPINGIRQRVGLSEVEDARQLQVECTVDGRSCVRFQDITQPADVDKALALAARSTHVLVFVATSSQEGMDRDNLTLTNQCQTIASSGGAVQLPVCSNEVLRSVDQDSLIARVVAEHGDRTAVVAVTPGALLTPWAAEGIAPGGTRPRGAAAVLIPFMPGQGYGLAIASILFGDRNPAARLPVTFPASETQQTISVAQYPGYENNDRSTPMPRPCTGPKLGPFPSCPSDGVATYSERLKVGYRWFDTHNETPAFPFGHGLSYTSFDYSALQTSSHSISVKVKNNGTRPGAEVAQLYLGFPPHSGEPPRVLKGFVKTAVLGAGESKSVHFPLRERDLSIWDVKTHNWAQQSGEFKVYVGASSRDIRATGTFTV